MNLLIAAKEDAKEQTNENISASVNQIQKVNTVENILSDQMNYSMDGAANDALQYSLISEFGDNERQKSKAQKQQPMQKRNRFNFTSRSFSMTDSPLRQASDALGVINEPKDIALVQNSPFFASFRNLNDSVNYRPSTLFLICLCIFIILIWNKSIISRRSFLVRTS